MALNITGLGSVSMRYKEPTLSGVEGKEKILLLACTQISLEEEIESAESMGCPLFGQGVNEAYDVMTISRTATLTVSIEQINADHLSAIAYNNAQGQQTIDLPDPHRIVLDDIEVDFAGLALDEPVDITVLMPNGFKTLTQVDAMDDGSPTVLAAGQFKVLEDEIVFHESDVDEDTPPIAQLLRTKQHTGFVIGGVNPSTPIRDVSIYLRYETTKGEVRAFYAPKATSTDGANFTFAAAGDGIERTFQLLVAPELGFNAPYADYSVSS